MHAGSEEHRASTRYTVSREGATEAVAAVSQGTLDATATWEPYVSMVERQGGRVLVTAKDLMPAPVYVVANTGHLDENRAATRS